ncbi:hypothetical protein ASG87_01520 [Frateuria sp. Soil773]|nr:hypothetical protein ASG87_01520 [Frateuria sp. Soil773]
MTRILRPIARGAGIGEVQGVLVERTHQIRIEDLWRNSDGFPLGLTLAAAGGGQIGGVRLSTEERHGGHL